MASKTVVIVEDEADTADMLVEMMRIIGYQAFKSSGGLGAVDLIAEKNPATILLDIMLPEISGLEVLQYIRMDARLRTIPVIMISAKSLPADKQQGLQAGAAVYLTKPVAFADLKSAIEEITQTVIPASN